MALIDPRFASNERLHRAAGGNSPMRRGEAVALTQTALAAMGIATLRRSLRRDGSMDGGFGSETERAVKRFQRSAGLLNGRGNPDGGIGGDTMHALPSRATAVRSATSARFGCPWPRVMRTAGSTSRTGNTATSTRVAGDAAESHPTSRTHEPMPDVWFCETG